MLLPTRLASAHTVKTPAYDTTNSKADTSAAVREGSGRPGDVTEHKSVTIEKTSPPANDVSPRDEFKPAKNVSPSDGAHGAKNVTLDDGFHHALLKYMSPDTRVIVLSTADSGYADMALNLYKTSYERFGITNHLFLGTDAQLCPMLNASGAHCVQFNQLFDESADYEASTFSTKAFKMKTFIRHKAILEALELNISVLMVDTDIVFFKNPLPLMTCDDCDLLIQDHAGGQMVNPGFFLIKPTAAGKALWRKLWDAHRGNSDDQDAINSIIPPLLKSKQLKMKILDKRFADGPVYFGADLVRRKSIDGFITAHNTFITTKARKIFRFKKFGLWVVDESSYYSNPNGKYMVYKNDNLRHLGDQEVVNSHEREAVKTAFVIGHILKRIVIVPGFICSIKQPGGCDFADRFPLWRVDQTMPNSYREPNFLQSDLVPAGVKKSRSATYLIQAGKIHNDANIPAGNLTVLKPANSLLVSPEEIHQWFDKLSSVSVLKFHSLYFSVNTTNDKFARESVDRVFFN